MVDAGTSLSLRLRVGFAALALPSGLLWVSEVFWVVFWYAFDFGVSEH
jgi:hypothetical protein